MIKQARRICSGTVVIVLLTIAVQADDEEDPAYVVQDGERVAIRVVPLRPDSKPDVQRERVRVVDPRRHRQETGGGGAQGVARVREEHH